MWLQMAVSVNRSDSSNLNEIRLKTGSVTGVITAKALIVRLLFTKTLLTTAWCIGVLKIKCLWRKM